MKRFVLILAILVAVSTLTACIGKPRDDDEIKPATSRTEAHETEPVTTTLGDQGEVLSTNFNIVEGDQEDVKSMPLAQITQAVQVNEVVYKCVNIGNATCTNNIQIPFLTRVNLTLTDVSVGGVKLNSLPFSIQFVVKDHGLKQIISEVTTTGNGSVLSISKEALWNKYGNVVFEKIIRKFLSEKNLASVLSLSNNNWKELLDILKTDTRNSPIEIIGVSGNLDNIFIKAPILVTK